MKPTKSDIQKLIQKSKEYDVYSKPFSSSTADLKKIQDALNKNSVVIVLK